MNRATLSHRKAPTAAAVRAHGRTVLRASPFLPTRIPEGPAEAWPRTVGCRRRRHARQGRTRPWLSVRAGSVAIERKGLSP